jgi:hypothetical protein
LAQRRREVEQSFEALVTVSVPSTVWKFCCKGNSEWRSNTGSTEALGQGIEDSSFSIFFLCFLGDICEE